MLRPWIPQYAALRTAPLPLPQNTRMILRARPCSPSKCCFATASSARVESNKEKEDGRVRALRAAEAREAALRAARARREKQDAERKEEKREYERRYKSAGRRWVSTIIALPILLVTSYYLFDRLVLGNAAKEMPRMRDDKTAGDTR